MTKEEILDKTHWDFVVEAGMSSIHNETFPLAYKGQAIIAMDVYYNQAIDEAISVVMENMGGGGLLDPIKKDGLASFGHSRSALISKLKSLKKQSNGRRN